MHVMNARRRPGAKCAHAYRTLCTPQVVTQLHTCGFTTTKQADVSSSRFHSRLLWQQLRQQLWQQSTSLLNPPEGSTPNLDPPKGSS
eukprot:365664-Chlamydomonas_euryale.AAC.8